jgi:hypothetical protein
MPERESDYYLLIQIYNSNKMNPVFNWSQSKGNIALGIAIAKEEVNRKINPEHESHYSVRVKLNKDSHNNKQVLFEKESGQGNIRGTLDSLDEFVHVKLGFDLVKQIKEIAQVPEQ